MLFYRVIVSMKRTFNVVLLDWLLPMSCPVLLVHQAPNLRDTMDHWSWELFHSGMFEHLTCLLVCIRDMNLSVCSKRDSRVSFILGAVINLKSEETCSQPLVTQAIAYIIPQDHISHINQSITSLPS